MSPSVAFLQDSPRALPEPPAKRPWILEFLSGMPLLAGASPELLNAVAGHVHAEDLNAGAHLTRQGELGDRLFFIVEGLLEARQRAHDGTMRSLGRVRRSEVVGELAVLTSAPRVCDVVALRESRVLAMERDAFLRLLERFPDLHVRIANQVIARTQAPATSRASAATVALVPLSRSAAPATARLARDLAKALERFGRVARADGSRMTGGVDPDVVGARLAAEEADHDRMIYEADATASPWTRCCLQRADLVLLVGDASASPELCEAEQTWLGAERPITTERRELVLVHRDRTEAPSGTARWLARRQVALHHHVAANDVRDAERLARFIVGRSVNVVLSGGGVRGFAHIGVVGAMLEAGIPVDFLGGTSVGAAVAAMFAMEWDGERVRQEVRRWLPRVLDRTFPMLSVFTGRRGTSRLREMLGERAIEDLRVNYFAVSADLRWAEPHVHRRGPLWSAVRSSTSIPGVLPPIVDGGRWLVDGGVLNNLPVDVMQSLTGGAITAVDVAQHYGFDFDSVAPSSDCGFRLALERLNPFRRKRLPHIGDILMRSSEIAAVQVNRATRERVPVALTITPPVQGYAMLDFDSVGGIIETGYRFARGQVETWREQLGLAQVGA